MYQSVFTDELGLDFAEALPILKSWGLTHVDLRGRIFGRPFEKLSADELQEVKRLLDEHSLKVGCLQSSLAKVHLPERERQAEEARKLEAIIRAADALHCRLVRAFFYWQPDGEEKGELAVRPDALQQVLDMFGPLAERAQEADLILAFEDCGVSCQEVLAVLDALGCPGWGLAWDVANEWEAVRQRQQKEPNHPVHLARRTRVVHVKARGAVEGLGDLIPWDNVLQTLDNAGFEGPVSVETHNPDPSVSNAEQSRRVLESIRRAWPSAAPGMVGEPEVRRTAVRRDYEPVGFVVVGLGMGRSRSKTVHSTPGARLVGVVDIDEERARATGQELGVPYTADLEPWLTNDEVEVVYVLTPTGRHAEVGLKALEAGKHVLTTKPMEASIGACDEMIRLAERKGLLLGVDFGMRFESPTLSLKTVVEKGLLGRMLGGEISLKVLRAMEYFRANGGWRGTRRWDGGGVLSNQTIHHIDQAAFILGVPKEVRCSIWTQDHDIEAEDTGCALWRYDDGTVISLFATTCYPQKTWYFRMELHGTEGAVSIVGGGPFERTETKWYLDGVWVDKPPEVVESPWLNAADNFAAAIRTGAPLVCSGRDGRRTQAILDAMYRSAYADEGWVEVQAEVPAD